jgi:hypothetical protein
MDKNSIGYNVSDQKLFSRNPCSSFVIVGLIKGTRGWQEKRREL